MENSVMKFNPDGLVDYSSNLSSYLSDLKTCVDFIKKNIDYIDEDVWAGESRDTLIDDDFSELFTTFANIDSLITANISFIDTTVEIYNGLTDEQKNTASSLDEMINVELRSRGLIGIENDFGEVKDGYSRYNRVLHLTNGKSIPIFQQWMYNDVKIQNGTVTIARAGCGYCALAMILSAFDPSIDPKKIAQVTGGPGMIPRVAINAMNKLFGEGEFTVISREDVWHDTYQATADFLADQIEAGGMGLATVGKGKTTGSTKFTKGSHYVSLLSVENINGQDMVYIGDPNDKDLSNVEPMPLLEFVSEYMTNCNIIKKS